MDKLIYDLVTKFRCNKCNKYYGQTNLRYNDCEVWLSCDCEEQDEDKIYFLNEIRVTAIKNFWENLTK